jgi:exopolysaccharide production protein ExoY
MQLKYLDKIVKNNKPLGNHQSRLTRRLEVSTQLNHLRQRKHLSIKRYIDVFFSFVLLIISAPIILCAAVAISATSRGPLFFLDKRYGFGEREFTCFKLRTMHVYPEPLLEARGLNNIGNNDRLLVFQNDVRVGLVGSWVRRLSIDELPQLLNVLLGDMSLIGPRPLPLSMLHNFPAIASARSVMRPGISGLWQVRNRKKNVSVLDMVDDDMEYIDTFCLGLDLKIAFLTISRIVEPPIVDPSPRM